MMIMSRSRRAIWLTHKYHASMSSWDNVWCCPYKVKGLHGGPATPKVKGLQTPSLRPCESSQRIEELFPVSANGS